MASTSPIHTSFSRIAYWVPDLLSQSVRSSCCYILSITTNYRQSSSPDESSVGATSFAYCILRSTPVN
eukprot:scaffold599675_cov50-Prasinocladus_malaysianus.AAC.1